MIPYREAVQLIKAQAGRFQPESEGIDLLQAHGRVVAEDILSGENIPYADNSSMDGFAVRAEEILTATKENPVVLTVKSIIAAGDCIDSAKTADNKTQSCVEIMTGALIPDEYYDAVVKIEDIERIGDQIKIFSPLAKGTNIRARGTDFSIGQLVVTKNTVLNDQHIMAMAALGVASVPVRKKLRVAVVSTGNELVTYNQKITNASQVRNSSAPYLKLFLEQNHCEVTLKGIQTDDANGFYELMSSLIHDNYDLILTTGAVSMGKWDFVLSTLPDLRMKKIFHKAAIRPGKPILMAQSEETKTVLFGLPGNPISTAVGAQFFVLPLIQKIMGIETHEKFITLENDVEKPEGLECFFKASMKFGEKPVVEALTGQASYMIHSFVRGNCWVQLPAETGTVKAGTPVRVIEFVN